MRNLVAALVATLSAALVTPQAVAATDVGVADPHLHDGGADVFHQGVRGTRYVPETKATVAARNKAGDSRVYFINTEGWLTAGADDADGDGHPDDQGQAKIADRLAPIIASRI